MTEFIEIPVTLRVNPETGPYGEVFLECADGGKWEFSSIEDFEDSFGVDFPNKVFKPYRFGGTYTLRRDDSVEISKDNNIYILNLECPIRCYGASPECLYIPIRPWHGVSEIEVTTLEGLLVADYYDLDIVVGHKKLTVVSYGDTE